MRKLVSSLTAAMLLVHALVGCCRHCDSKHACCEAAVAAGSLAADCCHHDDAAPQHDDERPIAPCDCKLGCKAHCVSLPPEETRIDAGRATLSIDALAETSRAGATIAANALAPCQGLRACQPPEPPLPLHLLHQAILV